MNGMDVCLITTICHISPLCHSFIAKLHLGLLDCHNSTRKCWNRLVLLIMRFVIFIIFIKVLKISRLFDQDQDFFFKTKIKTKTISRPRPFFMSSRCLKTKTKV